jgi:hypothetical protein
VLHAESDDGRGRVQHQRDVLYRRLDGGALVDTGDGGT